MPYVPYYADWHDKPTLDTPFTAAVGEHIESGIVAAEDGAASELSFVNRREPFIPSVRQWFGDKANTSAGSVPALDTGETPTLLDNGATGSALRVNNGFLTYAPSAGGNAAGYMAFDVGAPVTRIGARIVFDKTGRSTDGASVALAITSAAMSLVTVPNVAVHFVVTPLGWQLDVIAGTGLGGPTITNLAAGSFDVALQQDGVTEYEMQVWRNGTTVQLHLPDGTISAPITDSRIGSYAGNFGFVECFAAVGNTDAIARVSWVWAGTDSFRPSSQEYVTRKLFDQVVAWEPTIYGTFVTVATGQAGMPEWVPGLNRRIGAAIYFVKTAGTGDTVVRLKDNGVVVSGSTATILAGQVQAVAGGSWTFIVGHLITLDVVSVAGTPPVGLSVKLIKP